MNQDRVKTIIKLISLSGMRSHINFLEIEKLCYKASEKSKEELEILYVLNNLDKKRAGIVSIPCSTTGDY